MGCPFLLQEIFPTQTEPQSPALQVDSLLLSHQGSPLFVSTSVLTFIFILMLVLGFMWVPEDTPCCSWALAGIQGEPQSWEWDTIERGALGCNWNRTQLAAGPRAGTGQGYIRLPGSVYCLLFWDFLCMEMSHGSNARKKCELRAMWGKHFGCVDTFCLSSKTLFSGVCCPGKLRKNGGLWRLDYLTLQGKKIKRKGKTG